MAKYDAMGDRIQSRVPKAVWVMLLGLVIGVIGVVWCIYGGLDKYIKYENLSGSYDAADIKECRIDLGGGNSNIVRSQDGKIHITANNVIQGLYTVKCEKGKFSFKRNKFSLDAVVYVGATNNFFGLVKNDTAITIALPDKEYEKLEIDNSIGELSVSGVSAQKLDIDNGVGKVSVTGVRATESNIDNGVGEINITGSYLGETDIDNGVGRVSVSGSTMTDANLDNGVGEVTVTAGINGDIDVDNGIGKCELHIIGNSEDYKIKGSSKGVKIIGKIDTGNAKHKIKLDNGIGDITVEFTQ